jgi:phage-related protein
LEKKPKYKYAGILILEADWDAGDKFDIIAAVTESCKCPFWDEFYMPLNQRYNESLRKRFSLNKKDEINYRVLGTYFKKFCTGGSWNNKRQLRSIENGFYEFKCIETNLRVIFYYDDINRGVIILTHYFDKGGKDKTPQKEKERMYQIKESFEKIRRG